MSNLNPQAIELNDQIKENNPMVYKLLSRRGKAIFFPKKGILAQGQDAKRKDINATLGTAYEDDGSPMVLPCVADNVLINSRNAFPYAPSYGVAELRTKWKDNIVYKNTPLEGKAISNPVVTNALTHGLSILGYMFVEEGDEIILPDLYWGNYNLVFAQAYFAQLKKFRFFTPEGEFDIDSFKASLGNDSPGKKIVLLNFPNNPSGYSPTKEAAAQILDILKESAEKGNELLVICDDAYFGLGFEDELYQYSLFAELADLHENILAAKVDGVTKEEFAWGLRVGFLTFGIKNGTDALYRSLEDKASGAVRGNISNASHLSQSLVLGGFSSKNYLEEKKEKFNKLKERYDKVRELLDKNKQRYSEFFEALPFNSGYFMCVRIKDLDAEDVRKTLLDKYSTGVISINDLLRIAFSATPTDKIPILFENIYNACLDVKNG